MEVLWSLLGLGLLVFCTFVRSTQDNGSWDFARQCIKIERVSSRGDAFEHGINTVLLLNIVTSWLGVHRCRFWVIWCASSLRVGVLEVWSA